MLNGCTIRLGVQHEPAQAVPATYRSRRASFARGAGRFAWFARWPKTVVVALVLAMPTVAAAPWAFEETFGGDPPAPSQALLPRSFDYVVTHRTHPMERFT